MEKLKNILASLSTHIPDSMSESYDNTGLLIGSDDMEVHKVLVAYEITNEVIDEAISLGCQVILTHHPLIFKPLKKITGQNEVQRMVKRMIKSGLAHIAVHTNVDNIVSGLNKSLSDQIGLTNFRILKSGKDRLFSLVVFVPKGDFEKVEQSIFKAGAGHIGKYSHCGYSVDGKGSFLPLEGSNPAIGQLGQLERVDEKRLEVIVPGRKLTSVLSAMKKAHPYEEVAHFIIPLENVDPESGSGGLGELSQAMDFDDFIVHLKSVLNLKSIKISVKHPEKIQKVAICGGSGSFLIQEAKASGADVFITADVKYHDFFEADDSFGIIDPGHYESEIMIVNEFAKFLEKNFHTFAVLLSKVNTNPAITI
ncbi:Nif3-like dinuclear metal center hexameric protein [Schleiferia thermophila]|jgi:dinuclear metal center YbgI/SA1388 family protein|uniref:GTP cyclohydrolase 1 type 2 homolog n=1 Tax=Schleiferia thermophila TaxID=884107 RepID=A0A369A484_9FLAO|nr:Nif3-like dinuclear metal center hexameric protein [Schleiferia thermophila]KFD39267.1 NGG1p interacting factor 3 protein, NIF3 [Schleiferia thermophila str. Yellowstone]RCX03156.1 dinuclear metal center YbgI/SA1388 family protein [Schleiferia thermophila]GCD80284.1 GTP cyclohydrolase 1 type 2 [Schleiferia thermophila]